MKDKYAFKEVVANVAGVPVTGFFEGDDVIQINFAQDEITSVLIGADGEASPAVSADQSGTILFGLKQNGDSNAVFQALYDQQVNGTFAAIPIRITDLNSGEVMDAPKCVITRPANRNRGTAINRQDWTFRAEKIFLETPEAPNV